MWDCQTNWTKKSFGESQPKNGKVFISTLETEKNMISTVADTGIGIPDDRKQQIFEPFYRVDKSRSGNMSGAG